MLHGVINEIVAGFPVKPVLPCEGVGYEVGSMAIIKGARNLDAAKKFVDWALTAEAQKIGLDVKEFAIPTNRERAAAAAGAEARRHQGHRLRLREVRLERHAQAPARALGEGNQRAQRGDDDRRDARRAAALCWLAVGAAGFLLVPWYALQDSVLGAGAGSRSSPARTPRRRCCRSSLHGRAWLAPLGCCCSPPAPLLALGARPRERAPTR